MKRRVLLAGVLFFTALLALHGQDDFGFGFSEDAGSEASGAGVSSGSSSFLSHVKISGKAQVKLLGYVDDFRSASKLKNSVLNDIFMGKLNFNAGGSNAEGVINLKFTPAPFFDDFSPLDFIDESYVRAFFGSFEVEGGFRKLTWGKADSLGPLDVVNPMDYRDLTDMMDILGRKIARPMIHASYRFGVFTKLEGVFVPWFQGHRFTLDPDKRWAPSQVRDIPEALKNGIGLTGLTVDNQALARLGDMEFFFPSATYSLRYAQAGLRLTTTIGSSDLGIQYYFGRLPRPAVGNIKLIFDAFPPARIVDITADVEYNRYHQAGVDYAQVIAGFNLRAEAGANITEDLSGDRRDIYNPSIVWSLGFDRDLFAGINVNLQGNGSVRLLDHKISDSILEDTEAGKDLTSTRLTLILSRKFFRDELELQATGLWGIEDRDFLIMPAAIWTKGDLALEVSGGIFGGSRAGELGQYRRNGFVKTSLTYSF
jgi:hypothetical protein